MKKVLTTCGYCGCGCGFYLNVEDNQITGVTPKANHPVSKGKLCIKGWQGYTFVNHKDRLKKPLLKGEDGKFHETNWDNAIGNVTSRLKEVMDKYGPESIGILSSARCTNEENYLMAKLARSVIKTRNIDHCARL